MVIAADYPFLDIVGTMLVFFGWVIWFWMLVVVLSDVFRRHDVSGWGKAGWCILVIVLPFIGVFIYLIAHGKGMAERRAQDAQSAQAQMDQYVRSVAQTGGAVDEIDKAKSLLDQGAITQAEFDAIKAKALS
jgi:Short C-terminal domain/Phospholipase_D-nuclease N-terminal